MPVAAHWRVIALLTTMVMATSVFGEGTSRVLRVETFVVAPFVMERNGALTGFSIELWEDVAARLNLKTTYHVAVGVQAGLDALRSARADLLVSGVVITAERDREFDFSYPILGAGQQIMVRDSGETTIPNPLIRTLRLLISTTALWWLGAAVLLMLIPAHLIWVLERRHPRGIIPTKKYFPGIFHAMHWSATTLLTQADQTPRQPLARVVSFFLMFISVIFVALYTAQLTSSLTVEQIRGTINGPQDLAGKRVGTIKDSISVSYLRAFNSVVEEFPQTDAMFQALLDKKVDALLLGAPPLRYYATHEGKGLVRMVGPEFNRADAGIVFPIDSPLRRQVNSALVATHEDGTYQRLYGKWFGSQ